MLTAAGPKVIEFNVRLGDPETQAMLPLIDEPLLPLLVAGGDGPAPPVVDSDRARIASSVWCSRRAATRNPRNPTGVISGIDAAETIAGRGGVSRGNRASERQLVTAGGRVLTVAGRGADFVEAIARAYAGVEQISFDGMQYRRDIGQEGAGSRARGHG